MPTSRSKKKSPLAEVHQRALRAVEITETTPGPILHDFAVLLRYVQENTVELSKTGLLPIKDLHSLNAAMHRPLPIGLARPMLHCCPSIQGLYMILRVSALVRVEHKGRRRILRPDDGILAGWEALNETERYMYLLRAWLLWANDSILQSQRPMERPFILDLQWFLSCTAALTNRDDPTLTTSLGRNLGLFHVALAEMFGFVAVAHVPYQEGIGWRVRGLEATPFGRAFMALAEEGMPDVLSWEPPPRDAIWFEYWRRCVAPYFPDLHRDLAVPESQETLGTCILTVSQGKAWRQLAVPTDCSLGVVASGILDAFDFDHDHLYEFEIEDRYGILHRYHHFGMETPPNASRTRVGALNLQAGQRFRFHYDFGDDWWFGCVVDRIDPVDPGATDVRQIAAHGEAPRQYEW